VNVKFLLSRTSSDPDEPPSVVELDSLEDLLKLVDETAMPIIVHPVKDGEPRQLDIWDSWDP
jgi:hypothetical protein